MSNKGVKSLGFFNRRQTLYNAIADVATTDFSSSDDYVWSEGIPLRSGNAVTPSKSLALPSVYRSVTVIASICSDLQMEASRDGELVTPQPRLITKPDPDRSYRDWVHRTVMCMALHGEAFVKITFDSRRNQASFLQVLDPNLVVPEIDTNGKKTYRVTVNGKVYTYSDKEIYHLRLAQVPGSIRGVGPIQSARTALSNYLQAQEASENFFSERTIPSGVLSTTQETNKETSQALLAAWADMVNTPGATALLPPGMTYSALSLSPADLQFIETQQWSVLDVSRLFGIPPVYLSAGVEGSSMTYQNVNQVNEVFLKTTLRQYLGAIESMMTDISPGIQTVKFNTNELIGTDEAGQIQMFKTAVDAGFMTVDEVRARLKLSPINESPSE